MAGQFQKSKVQALILPSSQVRAQFNLPTIYMKNILLTKLFPSISYQLLTELSELTIFALFFLWFSSVFLCRKKKSVYTDISVTDLAITERDCPNITSN